MGRLWNGLLDLIGSGLGAFYDLIPNYGISIIILTIVISLLLFPLTLKQTRSMKAMQEIQPEVKRLQKELKGDRERLNQELMALYKDNNVNPAAGCLPMLVQLPIWFALFRVLRDPTDHVPASSALNDAIGRGRTDFLGMDLLLEPSNAISDGVLTALPYIIAILVVVATGYYQTRQTMIRQKASSNGPPPPQQQSMQTVMKIFPLIFGVISWTLPAGLVLYFAVSQMFRIGQQAVILRLDEKHAVERAAARDAWKAERERTGGSGGESTARSATPAKASNRSPGGSRSGGSRPQPRSKKKKRKRRRK